MLNQRFWGNGENKKSEQKSEENRQKSNLKILESLQKTEKYTENEKSRQKSRQKIVALISENPNITTTEMANKLAMTRSGIAKQIAILQEQNIIQRVGPDKGGHWEIVK